MSRVPVPRRAARLLGALLAVTAPLSCGRAREEPAPAPSAAVVPIAPAPQSPEVAPRVLYLPDATAPLPARAAPVAAAPRGSGRCPAEMVDVGGRFCIDRYEAELVDAGSGRLLSPNYHPTPEATRREYERWQRLRAEAESPVGKLLPVPAPDEWELTARRFEPLARSAPDVVPSGYLSGVVASQACERAGKRLCTDEEWVTACRGRQNRKFPYGHHYEDGKCNVFRGTHPAGVLHGDPSIGHSDPRLNLVTEADGRPLLAHTGATPECRSQWGTDAVYDMVGNLDEWVADPDGTFLGGFYARATREGCDARVEVHAFEYFDYSLGVRCCR